MKTPLIGAGLTIVYTALISGADGITKLIAGGYAAPQLYALSGLIVVVLSVLCNRHRSQDQGLRTRVPGAMALRAGATVIGTICFFYAFRLLPFADVFLFIGMVPLLAGLMSGPILGEPVRPVAWLALSCGFVGVLCLFPQGYGGLTAGHLWAVGAVLTGTFSMVMARYISRFETNALAQVLYPNAALAVTMALALPFVWQPMPIGDLAWVLLYAGLLFTGRWLLVVALRHLAAYAVTPLMNLQFVWMAILGAVWFDETLASGTLLGAAIVIGSGLVLIWDQFAPSQLQWPKPFGQRFRTDP